MKEFFKKFWWYALVPVALFVLSYILRKDTSALKDLISEKKKEIKKTKKEVKDSEEEVKKAEKKLEDEIDKTKETISTQVDDKEKRDEESKKFFPNL